MPQIIFTICLILDCLYFKQLYLIYSCVIIITYPLLFKYLIYISEIIRIHDIKLLDEHFIIEITSEDIKYEKSDYDEEDFLKPGKPTYFIDPSDIEYDSLDDKNKYLKTLKFIENQEAAIYCNDLLYEYKILSHNERKDIFILEEIKIPKPITKDLCKELLQFHINIYLLKENIINAKDYYKNYFVKIEPFYLQQTSLYAWIINFAFIY